MERKTQLEKKIARERIARESAESLLESKSLELYEANEALKREQNALEDRVNVRTQELQQLNKTLTKEIQKRLEAEKKLKQTCERALEIARLKSEFLANMSHEIRTPLNGVLGMASLLQSEPLSARQQDYVNTIRSSGESLLAVINDILDFSKIEADKLELSYERFDWRDCLDAVFELIAFDAGQKNLDLAYHYKGELPDVMLGDKTRLRQVLLNLLGNAVKFTDSGSIEIVVSAEPVDEIENVPNAMAVQMLQSDLIYEVTFAVTDTGIGISKAAIERLFEAFTQADTSITRKHGGTGLGLAICERLCRLMGGKIRVQSQPNEGATFYCSMLVAMTPDTSDIELPVAIFQGKRAFVGLKSGLHRESLSDYLTKWGYQVEPLVPSSDFADTLSSDDLIILSEDLYQSVEVSQQEKIQAHHQQIIWLDHVVKLSEPDHDLPSHSALSLAVPFKPRQLKSILLSPKPAEQLSKSVPIPDISATDLPLRILVVDDHLVNQEVMQRLLKRFGYRCEIAENGAEAVDAIVGAAKGRKPYELVFMDIQMPKMDGITATKVIHQQLSENQLPHIIALTAHALCEEQEKYEAAEMDGFLAKPIEVEALAETLKSAFYALHPDATADMVESAATPKKAVSKPIKILSDHESNNLAQDFSHDSTLQIDHAFLQASWGDDYVTLLIEVIPVFQQQAPHLVVSICQCIDQNNMHSLMSAAHTLKGVSLNIGGTYLSNICAQIEKVCRGELEADLLPFRKKVVQAFNALVEPLAILMATDLHQLRFSILSDYESVRAATMTTKSILQNWLPEQTEAANQFELALAEWLNNIVEHAYEAKPFQIIELQINWSEPTLTVSCFDHGKSLDLDMLNSHSNPTTPDSIAALSEGGRGLALIHQLVDRLDYDVKNGTNKMVLSKMMVAANV